MKLLLNQARRYHHLYSPSRCLQIRCFFSDPNHTTAGIENPRSYGATPLQQSPRLSPSENVRSLMDFTGISGYRMVLPTDRKPSPPISSSEKVFMEAMEHRHHQYISGSKRPLALSTFNGHHSVMQSYPPAAPPRFGNIFAAQFASFATSTRDEGTRKTEVKADTNIVNSLRPLSPHLPVYQPQLSSTISIFNRISGASLTAIILFSYLLCLGMGPLCFTYFPFYKFFFYSAKLAPTCTGIVALALSYHIVMGVRHLVWDFFGLK